MARKDRCSTGIKGLDEVLHGGLLRGRSYLARGEPGTGKTILGFHFLQQGNQEGERGLMIHLEESREELENDAASLGFSLDGIEFLDLSPSSESLVDGTGYDVFEPAEVEGAGLVEQIASAIEETRPDRVFLDPASQLYYLSPGDYQFRKRILSFKRYIQEHNATLLLASSMGFEKIDETLQYVTDGTIELYAEEMRRSVQVTKLRGSGIRAGLHDLRIGDQGIRVFPRLSPGTHRAEFRHETIPSGVQGLDEQLNGGLERGTVTIISGPTGVGKTTTGTQFVKEASQRGETSVIYLFEESEDTFLTRNRSISTPVDAMVEEGTLRLHEVEPLDWSADEFANHVKDEVENQEARVVMLDALGGYRLSLRGGKQEGVRRLHALGRYLKNMGVTPLFIDETSSILGDFRPTEMGLSYLADNIVFLRYVEIEGELRKVIGVLKKRVSDFERDLREVSITENGLVVGDRFDELQGLLGGLPRVKAPSRGS